MRYLGMLRAKTLIFLAFFILQAGCTLHGAVISNDMIAVKQLLQDGEDINKHSDVEEWRTPLILAAYHGHFHVLKYLAENGAKIDATDLYGYTALLYGAYYDHPLIVEYLIKSGANLDLQNDQGFTALIYGAYYGKWKIVKALVDAGADKSIRNKEGYTAFDYAKTYQFTDIANYLEK